MQELASKRNIRTANATLKGGREEECVINSLDASYVLFKKVLQLFMTEVVDKRSSCGIDNKQFSSYLLEGVQISDHARCSFNSFLSLERNDYAKYLGIFLGLKIGQSRLNRLT